jgi:hypothetical protein
MINDPNQVYLYFLLRTELIENKIQNYLYIEMKMSNYKIVRYTKLNAWRQENLKKTLGASQEQW